MIIMQNKASIHKSQMQVPLPTFQQKVSACMIKFGTMEIPQYLKTLQQILDQEVTILGDELYNSHIRPICLEKKLLWQEVIESENIDKRVIADFGRWNQRNIQQAEQQKQQKEQQEKKQKKQKYLKSDSEFFNIFKKYQKKKNTNSSDQEKNQNIDKKDKKKLKKGSKADQNQSKFKKTILKQHSANIKFFSDLQFLFSSFHPDNLQTAFGLSSKILQVKLITFFYIRNFIDYNYPKKRILLEEVYETIHVIKRVIQTYDKIIGPKYSMISEDSKNIEVQSKCQISRTLMSDLKLTFQYLAKNFCYNNLKVLYNYPRLSYDNKYYKFFSSLDVRAYPSQIELMQYLQSAINEQGKLSESKVISYNTMVGSGKTSIMIALTAFFNKLNGQKLKNSHKKIKLMFTCQLASVRTQVARLLYKNNLPFCIAKTKTIKRQDKNYLFPYFENYFIDGNEQQANIIICDWQTCYLTFDRQYTADQLQILSTQLMNQKHDQRIKIAMVEPSNTILFVDEPSYACNNGQTEQTYKLMKILKNRTPKITILSSATFPQISELPLLTQLISQQNPKLICQQIKSKQFQIGCQFCTFKGQILFPHTGATTKEQIISVLRKIEQNPFIMRLYTGTGLIELLDKCKKHQIIFKNNLDLQSYNTTISYKDFPSIAIQILNKIAEQQNNVIESICKMNKQEYDRFYEEDSQQDDIFEREKFISTAESDNYVNFKKIITTDAYKFLGGCIIATADPVSFALKHFGFWVQQIPSVSRLRNKSDAELLLLIPNKKIINSITHYNAYFANPKLSKHEQITHLSKLVNPFFITDVLESLEGITIDDFIVKLLLCGIGIVAESGLPAQYLTKVQEMASMNQLSYIVSDRALCSGVNFPISNVILLDDLGNNLELNEIFQLLGRAGRVGRSWAARSYIQEQTRQKLFKYIQGENNKTGRQLEVFEQLAYFCITNPELKFRTTRSQITNYKNPKQLKDNSQLQIRIKDKENSFVSKNEIHQIKLLIKSEKNQLLAKCFNYRIQENNQTFNLCYYKFPKVSMTLQDLPTRFFETQNQNKQVVDIKAYYENEQKYINSLIKNAIVRTLNKQFSIDVLKQENINKQLENLFSFENYLVNYCKQTSTFTVFIEYFDQILSNQYTFSEILMQSNPNLYLSHDNVQMIKQLEQQSQSIFSQMTENPVSILNEQIKKIRKIYQKIRNQRSPIWTGFSSAEIDVNQKQFIFFNDLYKSFQQQVDNFYSELTKQVDNKESLLYENECRIIIFCQICVRCSQITEDLFCMDQDVRSILRIDQLVQKIGLKVEPIQMEMPMQSNQEILEEQKIVTLYQHQINCE